MKVVGCWGKKWKIWKKMKMLPQITHPSIAYAKNCFLNLGQGGHKEDSCRLISLGETDTLPLQDRLTWCNRLQISVLGYQRESLM